MADLPKDRVLLGFFNEAAAHIREGRWVSPFATRPKGSKPPLAVPSDFAQALKQNLQAQTVFDASAPSCRREYVEWITGAKRDDTRTRRIAQAVADLALGRQRNWKYQAR